MDVRLLIPILSSFFITLFLLPIWIRKIRNLGLVWEDMNKISKDKIPGFGGLVVVLGFVIGILIFVGYRIFVLKNDFYLIEILSLLNVILILAGIGLIDDLFGWKKGGLKRKHRIVLVLIAAIPLMAINAGKSEMIFPFFGRIDL